MPGPPFLVSIGADGIARSPSGLVSWVPRLPQAQLTEAWATCTLVHPSFAALAISGVDYYIAFSQPWTALLPAVILEIVREEPSGAIGLCYRRYIKSSLLFERLPSYARTWPRSSEQAHNP